MRPGNATLVHALRNPAALAQGSPPEWTALLADARRCNLIGALAAACSDAGVAAPPDVQRHLTGARQVAERQRLSVRWEVAELEAALAQLGVPVLLLKGAAYVMRDDGLARGRMFGDIDILVPHAALGDVESALMLAGWFSAKVDAYDQRYYRQWMHELPPMTHVRRGTVLDVHHRILPPTARHASDPRPMIARATPIDGLPVMHIPAPEDLLAHSLTHLMHEGELHNGIRDLHDVDEMARRFGADPGFWPRFADAVERAGLARPVGLGLHLARQIFDSPMPEDLVPRFLGASPPAWLMAIYRRGLGVEPTWQAVAELAVYVRAHALRMPWPLLMRHLAVKAWHRMRPEPAATKAGAAQP